MNTKLRLTSIMNNWAPEDTAEQWDNVGLQLDVNQDINRCASALEINMDTWESIKSQDYQMVITHHPLIFDPVRSLSYGRWTDEVIMHMVANDMGLYVAHTNLDKAIGGVNDRLVQQYRLRIAEEKPIRDDFGKIVYLSRSIDIMDLQDSVPVMNQYVPDELDIKTVAFCAGSGKSFVRDVIEQNVNCYVTGELGYHDIQLLRQQGIAVLLLGHYESELFVLEAIEARLRSLRVVVDIIQ